MKNFDNARRLIHLKYGKGELPTSRVEIYAYNVSVAKSGMSALIRAFIVLDGRIAWLCETRIVGCGLDRGHELACDLFRLAYPSARYQDWLQHEWI